MMSKAYHLDVVLAIGKTPAGHAGLQTLVGVSLGSLQQGAKPEDGGNIYEDGDSNQASPLAVSEHNFCHYPSDIVLYRI